ncbi:TPA: hypothetical protein ACH3X1_014342 [Trebouxia sp. C0004]
MIALMHRWPPCGELHSLDTGGYPLNIGNFAAVAYQALKHPHGTGNMFTPLYPSCGFAKQECWQTQRAQESGGHETTEGSVGCPADATAKRIRPRADSKRYEQMLESVMLEVKKLCTSQRVGSWMDTAHKDKKF